MKLLITAVFLVGMATAAGPAAAQNLAVEFQTYCMGAGGNAAAMKRARADGFVKPPPVMMTSLPPDMVGSEVLWRVAEGRFFMLLLGDTSRMPQNPFGKDMDGEFCAVLHSPGIAAVEKALETVLNVGAPVIEDGQAMFVYEDADGRRRPVDVNSAVAMVRAMDRGRLHMALAMSEDDMSMMMIINVRTSDQPS